MSDTKAAPVDDDARKTQYETADNLNVRSWFNNDLPKLAGCDAFEFVGQLIDKLDLAGNGWWAEVGCGAGVFWDKNHSLLTRCNKLVLSDYSQGMLNACAEKEWYKDCVTRIESFTMDLSEEEPKRFLGGPPFDIVLALFMLYELRTATAVQRALANIKKSLNPKTGVAVIMTMDERVHMQELYQLLHQAKAEVEAETSQPIKMEFPKSAPAIQAFCAGNAEAQLKPHFSHVQKFELPSYILITQDQPHLKSKLTGAQCIVKYLKSLEFVQRGVKEGHLDDRFFSKLEQVAAKEIAASVKQTLIVRRLDVVYVGS